MIFLRVTCLPSCVHISEMCVSVFVHISVMVCFFCVSACVNLFDVGSEGVFVNQ